MAQQMSLPKPYSYFQTALADPLKKMSAPPHPTYLSATSSPTPPPPSGTLKLTVGTPPSQRTWYLPKALLSKHSVHFAKLCSNPYRNEATLQDIDPRTFANFVDFLHSNIYSLNPHVPNFRQIRGSIQAALLGTTLSAKTYTDAALRQLHQSLEPVARLRKSTRRMSLIRASDVEYVCLKGGSNDGPGKKIKKLLFDSVASHWRQRQVVAIADETNCAGDAVSWAQVYTAYPEFRDAMQRTAGIVDMSRSALLRPVEEYLVDGGEGGVMGGRVTGRSLVQSMAWVPSVRRSGSVRRRVKRAETRRPLLVDAEAESVWAVGVTPISDGGEQVVNGDDEASAVGSV